jgi:hypothetical protein
VAGADCVAAFRDEQSPRGRVLRGPVCGNAATRGLVPFRSSIQRGSLPFAAETALARQATVSRSTSAGAKPRSPRMSCLSPSRNWPSG